MKTTGKEDEVPSPYLQEPFDRARKEGVIPPDMTSIGGTWSSIGDEGDATNLNLVYMPGYDSTDVRRITAGEMDGRAQAMLAIEALRRYVPGFEKARLRNFGMTLGTRDSRKIVGRYNMTGDDVLNEARFQDSDRHFPGVRRRVRHRRASYHRPVLPRALRHPRPPAGGESVGRRTLRRGRPGLSRGAAEHDVLRSDGAGRRRRGSRFRQTGVAGSAVDIGAVQQALIKQGVRIL